jgi:hypothetical protein
MTPLLIRLLGFAVVFTLFCGCALTRDRFRPMPTQGQTREQGLKDQEECNDVALANKGSAAQASAMGSPVGVAARAAIGGGLGVAPATAGVAPPPPAVRAASRRVSFSRPSPRSSVAEPRST